MNIKYKIIEVWPDEHQIVVRYTTDLITEESVVLARDADDNIVRCRTDVPITLPIPTPTGDALQPKKLIKCYQTSQNFHNALCYFLGETYGTVRR